MPHRRMPFHAMASAHGAQMGRVGGDFLNAHTYGDPRAEHLNTRAAVGLQDLSTMGKIDIKGPEAAALVDHLIVNDAGGMVPGQARYSSVCDANGGIMDDLTVFRLAEEHFLIVTGSLNRLKLVPYVRAHAEGRRAYVTDLTAAIAFPTIQGPSSRALLQTVVTGADLATLPRWRFTYGQIGPTRVMISRTGVTGELGFELFVPADEAASVWLALFAAGGAFGLRPYGVNAMFTLGLEKLYPAHGTDMDESRSPFHLGLDRFIRFEKPDFIGRDALLRLRDQGVDEAWVGLWLDSAPVPAGTAVMEGRRTVGHVTYADIGHSVGQTLATAHVLKAVAVEGMQLHLATPEGPRPARVTRRAFFDPEGTRLRA